MILFIYMGIPVSKTTCFYILDRQKQYEKEACRRATEEYKKTRYWDKKMSSIISRNVLILIIALIIYPETRTSERGNNNMKKKRK